MSVCRYFYLIIHKNSAAAAYNVQTIGCLNIILDKILTLKSNSQKENKPGKARLIVEI